MPRLSGAALSRYGSRGQNDFIPAVQSGDYLDHIGRGKSGDYFHLPAVLIILVFYDDHLTAFLRRYGADGNHQGAWFVEDHDLGINGYAKPDFFANIPGNMID